MTNAEGRRAAHGVEVIVTRVETLGLNPNWDNVESSTDPRDNLGALPWTHSNPPELTIGPGAVRTVDLAYVVDADKYPWLTIPMSPAPLSGIQHLLPGSYRLLLALVAHDVDASHYELDVKWDGMWTGDRPLSDHLEIGELKKTAARSR